MYTLCLQKIKWLNELICDLWCDLSTVQSCHLTCSHLISTVNRNVFFSATCDLPCGDTVSQELSEAEVDKLRMDCIFADPATDKAAILGAMSKTAAARQQWIRGEQPSITTVLDQYPRMEDMPVDIVRYLATQVCMCKEL